MKAAIIIPVTRPGNTLNQCINKLLLMQDLNFEIILVGNVKSIQLDSSVPIVCIYESNLNGSLRRNIGAFHTDAEILCFIDDDVQVPEDWLSNIKKILKEHPNYIIGGPNIEGRKELKYQIPAVITASVLSEGLISHQSALSAPKKAGIHDLPLCNLSMKRDVFISIGGFNDKISHFLDDVEFNFAAVQKGYPLYLFPELTVQHDIRPFFLPFYRYKLKTRQQIGKNFIFFFELYKDSLGIKMVLLSYLLIPLMLIITPQIFIALLVMYCAVLSAASIQHLKKHKIFVLFPLFIFLTHLTVYSGFTLGLLAGIMNFNQRREYIKLKRNM